MYGYSSLKITYKRNKGSNHKGNPATYYNQKVTLKNPVRKGYVFGGWYSDSKFKKKSQASPRQAIRMSPSLQNGKK